MLCVTSHFLHSKVYIDVYTFESFISSCTKQQFKQKIHNSAAPQTSLFTATLHMFLLQFNTTRILDRQVCYSCKLTHTSRSSKHFQHSLFIGCWYLGGSVLPTCSTAFPATLTLTQYWNKLCSKLVSSPVTKSYVMWKDLIEQLGPPKNAPVHAP